MVRFSLARLTGHSSQAVPARYYIHVSETPQLQRIRQVREYQTGNIAEGIAAAFPETSRLQLVNECNEMLRGPSTRKLTPLHWDEYANRLSLWFAI